MKTKKQVFKVGDGYMWQEAEGQVVNNNVPLGFPSNSISLSRTSFAKKQKWHSSYSFITDALGLERENFVITIGFSKRSAGFELKFDLSSLPFSNPLKTNISFLGGNEQVILDLHNMNVWHHIPWSKREHKTIAGKW